MLMLAAVVIWRQIDLCFLGDDSIWNLCFGPNKKTDQKTLIYLYVEFGFSMAHAFMICIYLFLMLLTLPVIY